MAVAVLDIRKAAELHRVPRGASGASQYEQAQNSPEAIELLDRIVANKLAMEPDQSAFATLCDRWDNLYWPQAFTTGGASHWANNSSAYMPGRAHISVNSYPIYVDIPAALQSVPPVENMVATDENPMTRTMASLVERLYTGWKGTEQLDLKFHRACVVKGLYGRTAGKVYWDAERKLPALEIVDQPRNLYLGYRDSDYNRLEWALYTYQITPESALEDWGLEIDEYEEGGKRIPYVVHPAYSATYGSTWRANLVSADLRVEVYDYWYRKPRDRAKVKFGEPTKFDTWNGVFVGNVLVKNERHPEYKGQLPYVPLFNTYVPGVPNGRPEFYDIEQLLREKDERMSENAQMISRVVNGQMWQLTGQEAPSQVPAGLRPTPNNIIAPGAGNRIEKIEPWAPEFQVEQFLGRLDKELVDVSGLNDLLRGMAPSQVLSSGKAISALVANYETRIRMKRDLAYIWRKEIWELAATVWGSKQSELKPMLEGIARLEIEPPSLTPRDDLEASSVASNLKEQKLWSLRRAMDHVGVDDPETEIDLIREEQTDATLNPAAVQVMAQLLGILQQLGIQPQPELQQAVQQQAGALNDVRQLAPDQQGQTQLNAPGEQPVPPNEQMPGNTPEGAAIGAGGPPVGAPAAPGAPVAAGQDVTLQTAIKGGEPNSRILQQQRLSRQPQGQ